MFKKNIKKFKKVQLKNRFKKNNPRWQNRLDNRLVYKLNKKRIPNWRQFIKLPEFLSISEKKILVSLLVLFFVSASLWSFRFYNSNLTILPTVGGEYTEGLIGTPVYINPILKTTDVERDLSSLIFSGLMRHNKNQELVLDLAESYEIDESKKNYTFKLKSNIKWHDGELFNADDVIFTIERAQNAEFKSPLYVSFKGVSIKKIDDSTIAFSLEEPYTPFLNMLTVGILPEHIWSNIEPSGANLSPYNLKPIGTGMWKFDKISTEKTSGSLKSLDLIRFDEYYGELPYLNKLVFKFYPDFVQAIDALQNKNIQGLGFISKEEKSKIDKLKYINSKTLNLPQYTAVFFNQKNNNALRDYNVRKSLAYAIDKNLVIDRAVASEGEVIHGPILPGYIGYNPDIEKYELNIAEANKILDKSKWSRVEPDVVIEEEKAKYNKELESLDKQIKKKNENQNEENNTNNADSETATLTLEELEIEKQKILDSIASLDNLKRQEFYRKKGDQFLEIKLTTIDRTQNNIIAELLRDAWSKIGVRVIVETIDKSRIQKDIIKPRNYESLLFSIAVGFDPDPYPFWHSSQNQDPGLNLAVFSNKEVDKLLEDARQTTDESIRSDKYTHFQNILVKELPALFLYTPTYTYPLSEKIKGFDVLRISLPFDRFNNIEEWYVETRGEFKWK